MVDDHVHLLAEAREPKVLLLGHFDTVWPLGTVAQWPFSITGDIAVGPGIFDMKAGIVQLVAAVELLLDSTHVSVLFNNQFENRAATTTKETNNKKTHPH
ncbi:M20/M25/M40 family metallo-hydrolase, partial [Nocardia sp. NPDC058497]|uniref:M20/M25/M40 family metallo-hydrolase n=1 Tax=Nocardia sp. NPDC058497 TaxID=3346529 RepID=UPI003665FC06